MYKIRITMMAVLCAGAIALSACGDNNGSGTAEDGGGSSLATEKATSTNDDAMSSDTSTMDSGSATDSGSTISTTSGATTAGSTGSGTTSGQ